MEGCGRLEIEVQRIGGGSHQWKAGRGKGALIKRIGPHQTMRDLVKLWEIFKKLNHMLWFQCLTQFHSGCEGVVKVRQCQKRRSCMQGQVLLGGAIHFFTHTALKSATAHWWVRVQFSLRLFCHLAFTLCQDGQTCPTRSSLHTNLVNKKGWQFWKWEIKPSLKTAGGHKVLALQGWWLPSPTDDGCVQARAPSRLGFGGHHQ